MSNRPNLTQDVKYIFLRFAQAYFADYKPLKWDYDALKTNIVIVDRHATELGIATVRPTILLTRGDLAWTFTSRGQSGTNAVKVAGRPLINRLAGSAPTLEGTETFTDLMRGSITFNVLSKNGIQAENIANHLFVGLTAYKNEFRKNGIHQFVGLSIGAEQLIKANASIELIGVPIYVSFLAQRTVIKDAANYTTKIVVNGQDQFEQFDYTVIENGSQIKFNTPLEEDAEITIDYINAITLEPVVGAIPVSTGVDGTYSLPDNGVALGHYNLFKQYNIGTN